MLIAIHFISIALTAMAVNQILPEDLSYSTNEQLILFSLVLGLFNLVLRPILQVLALPLTCLTLGLFALIINVVVFYLGGNLISGVEVTWLGAVVGSVLLGAITGVLSGLVRK